MEERTAGVQWPGGWGVAVLLGAAVIALLVWWPWEDVRPRTTAGTEANASPGPPATTSPASLTDWELVPGVRYEDEVLICRTDCSAPDDVVTVTVSVVAPGPGWFGRIDSGQGGVTTHRATKEGFVALGWNPIFGWSGHAACAEVAQDAVVAERHVHPVDDLAALAPHTLVTGQEDASVGGRPSTSLELVVGPCAKAADERWPMVTTGHGDRRPRARIPDNTRPGFFHLVALPEISDEAHLAIVDLSGEAANPQQAEELQQVLDSLEITVE